MKNIVVMISGRGSNFVAIREAASRERWELSPGASIALVVSNVPGAKGLEHAREAGIPTLVVNHRDYPGREAFEDALIAAIGPLDPAVIVLAGFMRVLTSHFTDRFPGRILNIHPAILPSFKGLDTHERAIQAGVRMHGTTVHFVTPELDSGAVIGQAAVPVLPSDDPDRLAARVLTCEHRLYPACVKAVLEGRVRLVQDKAVMDDATAASLTLFAK